MCGPNRPSNTQIGLIKTEPPADPPIDPLIMQSDGVWECAGAHFLKMCASIAPSARYILHNDADISNTASRRVP